jgi:hypothetical protein
MKILNRQVVRGQKRRFLPACVQPTAGWLAEIAAGDFGQ